MPGFDGGQASKLLDWNISQHPAATRPYPPGPARSPAFGVLHTTSHSVRPHHGSDMEFHHAGIATSDGPATAALFADLLGTEVVHEESLDGIDVAFLDVGDGLLEILQPTDEGTVSRFLDREGPGIHHLAFTTEDLPGALEHARSLDVELIDEEPRPGAAGHEVAFLHPRDTDGVLIEFVSE